MDIEDEDDELQISEGLDMDVEENESGPSLLLIPSYQSSGHLTTSEWGSSGRGTSLELPTELPPWHSDRSTSSVSVSTSMSRNSWYPIQQSEDRQLNVLYVPDPSRTLLRPEAEENIGWADRHITEKQYEAIKGLTRLVYKVSKTKKYIRVLVSEWVRSVS